MTAMRKAAILLRPSFISGIGCGLITCAVIAFVAWIHITDNGLFYDFLFGRFGVTTALITAPQNISVFQQAVFNSPVTYYFVIGIAAIMVGILVYALLQGVGRIREEALIVASELRTHNPHLKSTVYNDLSRLGVRLASLAAWLIYWIVFIDLVWPFVVSLMQVGLIDISASHPSGWLYICAATLLWAVSVHMHVTFMRLCALRLRLFGNYLEGAT